MPDSERILVTGAAGFVGSTIATLLRGGGYEVVAHARRAAPGIDRVADLGERSAGTRPFPRDIAAVVHCSAAISIALHCVCARQCVRDRRACRSSPATDLLRRIVHLSSVAVYKRPSLGSWIISEDTATVDIDDLTADPYARSKRASELALDSLADRRPDVKVTHLRPSSIYGPGMVLTTLLPALVSRARRQESLRLCGPRGYMQNFVHVRDVAELIMALVCDLGQGRVINAFSDDTYGLLDLADLVQTGLNSQSQVVDVTDDTAVPEATFVNTRAKQFHPRFRRLAEHLLDVT